MTMVGRHYMLGGQVVVVRARWLGVGCPRNVLIEFPDGALSVRPFRGLRRLRPGVPEPEESLGLFDPGHGDDALNSVEGVADLEGLIEVAHDAAALVSLGVGVVDEVPGPQGVVGHPGFVAGHDLLGRLSFRIDDERLEPVERGVDPAERHRLIDGKRLFGSCSVDVAEAGQEHEVVAGALERFSHDGLTLHDAGGYR